MADTTRRIVSVGSLGGTITMVPDEDGQGIKPTLTAEQLLASVPGLEDAAEIRAETILQKPGASLTPLEVLDAVTWARAQVDQGAAGVVLVQGTDTLEETSWLAELVWDREEPLVFVGAMRGAAALSADGPANLMAACTLAASDLARNKGVMLILDDVIHHASYVYKNHTSSLAAFESTAGSIGRMIEGAPVFREFSRPVQPLAVGDVTDVVVPAWTTYMGDDGSALIAICDNAAGVVVGGVGAGHVPEPVAEAMTQIIDRMPVVFTSALPMGGTLTSSYGFNGSETDLIRRGAIWAGGLNVKKSRLLLWLHRAAGSDNKVMTSDFECRGRAALV